MDSGGIFWRIFPRGTACRLADGEDRLQTGNPCWLANLRHWGSVVYSSGVGKTVLFFLFALFIMACGQGVLEVAANPYVTILGPPESSERRLNLAQSFNAVGAVVTPIIGRAFILSGIEYSANQLSAMTPEQSVAYSALEASRVRGPYLAITGLFLFVAALLYFARLPEVREVSAGAPSESEAAPKDHWAILRYKHLVKGVIA